MNHDSSRIETGSRNDLQPLLIYDGECGFCTYWARYWQKLTGNSVQYKPYQEIAEQYPSIPIKEFQRAVQYVSPEGKISSAAEASFLTLSHAHGKSFWLSLYRRLPGFAFISEKAYTFISTHRSFFYRLSLLFWGREHEPPRFELVSWLFLRIFGLIYLSAFISFGSQALGLIGSQGIIPVSELVNAAQIQLGIERYWFLPLGVFWLNSSDFIIQAICWGGAALSLLLVFNILPRAALIFLYVFYLSLVCAGRNFMTFQWDLFLLETGILAFILVQFSTLGIWLLRWLLFRFIFVAGMVKVLSGDPTWHNFSALSYYFLTQPLPTPLAWYVHHLPQSILTVVTVAALVVEIVVPFLIFFPRRLRFFAAYAILLMQAAIILTGNYNFFNILTMTLCLTLFDDAALSKIIPKRLTHYLLQRVRKYPRYKITSFLVSVFAVFTVLFSVMQLYLRLGGSAPAPIASVYQVVAPFCIVNVYGPFSVITTERMEIIVEGSNDGVNWSEYAFKYKPGDVNRRPPWNIPHQPRLDWQMWFAALSSPDDNPWFLRFMQRLSENSPDVIALLAYNPFPDKPPQYVRAEFYEYRFTTSEERKQTGAWWDRRLVRLYYPT